MTSGNQFRYNVIACSELLLQFPHYQKRIIGYLETGTGKLFSVKPLELGSFISLLASSFLSYLVGYVGPFAFCGKL